MQVKKILGIGIIIFGLNQNLVTAEIKPDNSLGKENSQVNQKGQIEEITGGARRGNSVFHSFKEFSVTEGQGAYFIPGADIANIFSRVTGNKISNINGILGVKGKANLFFLNPNGIIFGPSAKLNLRGSFIATTGDSFIFANGSKYSAVSPQTAPLLTVNAIQPIGIKYGDQSSTIVNQSLQGLQVEPGKTLALLGGQINIEGGTVSAPKAFIELGAVATNNTIELKPNGGGSYSVSYLGVKNFEDVTLTQFGLIDTTGAGGGINIQAKNLTLSEGSTISSRFPGELSGGDIGSGEAGNIFIKTTDRVKITGFIDGMFANLSSIRTELNDPNATGNGGNITIETGSLVIGDWAQILTSTQGNGNAGNVLIKAKDSVQIKSIDNQASFYKGIIAQVENPEAKGQGGNVTVETASLQIADGGVIQTTTQGMGNAGNILINATDSVDIRGVDQVYSITSGLKAEVVGLEATGRGGNITINTASLHIAEGGSIFTSTQGQGNAGNMVINATDSVEIAGIALDNFGFGHISGLFAQVTTNPMATGKGGNITINTTSLRLTDGAQISTSTVAQGNAGNVLINATNFVDITGIDNLGFGYSSALSAQVLNPMATGKGGNITLNTASVRLTDGGQISTFTIGQGDAGNVVIYATNSVEISSRYNQAIAPTELSAKVLPGATGGGGNINLQSPNLTVLNGTVITVQSEGMGTAGNINIQGDNITLDNQANISGETKQGNGGNIFVGSNSLLLLRNGSNISASAGTASAGGDGGNIDMNAKLIVAFPQENSNITANAFTGSGGQVNINTRGLFGIQAASQPTSISNITASSQQGPQGTVIITIPNVQPTTGLIYLASGPISLRFARLCDDSNQSQTLAFRYAGNAGIASKPDDFFKVDLLNNPWLEINFKDNQSNQKSLVDFNLNSMAFFLPCK